MEVQHLFDPRTWTVSYVVFDPRQRIAVVIDPVADFDPVSGRVFHTSASRLLEFLRAEGPSGFPWCSTLPVTPLRV